MKCEICGMEFSEKVCKIHRLSCKIEPEPKNEQPEDLSTLTKRDLMVKIMSESDTEYKENDLKRMNKAELISLCNKA